MAGIIFAQDGQQLRPCCVLSDSEPESRDEALSERPSSTSHISCDPCASLQDLLSQLQALKAFINDAHCLRRPTGGLERYSKVQCYAVFTVCKVLKTSKRLKVLLSLLSSWKATIFIDFSRDTTHQLPLTLLICLRHSKLKSSSR